VEISAGIREAAWSKARFGGVWARVLDNQNGDGGVLKGTRTFHVWYRDSVRKFPSVCAELRPCDIALAGHSNGLKYCQVSLGSPNLKTLIKVKPDSDSCDNLKIINIIVHLCKSWYFTSQIFKLGSEDIHMYSYASPVVHLSIYPSIHSSMHGSIIYSK
jgi:hypothetical protein